MESLPVLDFVENEVGQAVHEVCPVLSLYWFTRQFVHGFPLTEYSPIEQASVNIVLPWLQYYHGYNSKI